MKARNLAVLLLLGTLPAEGQTFKGHSVGETTAEFLSKEPAIQAKLTQCQSNPPRELTPDEIKKRYGKKAYEELVRRNAANDAQSGGHPLDHIGIMNVDGDLYGQDCGAVLDAMVKGTGLIDGVGFNRHSVYWFRIFDKTMAQITDPGMSELSRKSDAIESQYDKNGREFYFYQGVLTRFSIEVLATLDAIKGDVDDRVHSQPKEVSIPYHNALGSTWNDVTLIWDTAQLHVEVYEDDNPAKPRLPRLTIESQALFQAKLKLQKAAPRPLD